MFALLGQLEELLVDLANLQLEIVSSLDVVYCRVSSTISLITHELVSSSSFGQAALQPSTELAASPFHSWSASGLEKASCA